MSRLKLALSLVPVLLLAALVAAPIGPMPGLFIRGTPTEPPAQWADTAQVDEIKLKVPGPIPRVVIIWVVEHGGELHVVGSRGSGWVERIGSGSPVEMRMGDRTYALTAAPVVAGWEEILEAYVAKYEADYPDVVAGFPSIEEAADTVAVFRLDRS